VLGLLAMRGRSWFGPALTAFCTLAPALAHGQDAAPREPARPGLGRLFAPPASGAGAEPELAEIAALLKQLEQHADAESAHAALVQARSALARARAAAGAADRARATRAKQSAWAALAWASHRIGLAAATRARIVAELRARRAEAACREAERTLTAVRAAAQAVGER
jgi:hypothetical protein